MEDMTENMKNGELPSKTVDDPNDSGPIDDTGIWQRTKRRIHKLELYQLFFVRAWNNNTSRGLMALVYVFSIVGPGLLLLEMLNPVRPLEKMDTVDGVIERYIEGRKRDKIYIRCDDGKTIDIFTHRVRRNKLKPYIGHVAKVYYKSEIRFFIKYRDLDEVKIDNTMLLKYNFEERKSNRKQIVKILIVFTIIDVFLFTSIFIRHKQK